jgi:hypothetical protein
MGRADDTALSLRVARNRNGLRALTTQESHGFSRVECQTAAISTIGTEKVKLDSNVDIETTLNTVALLANFKITYRLRRKGILVVSQNVGIGLLSE